MALRFSKDDENGRSSSGGSFGNGRSSSGGSFGRGNGRQAGPSFGRETLLAPPSGDSSGGINDVPGYEGGEGGYSDGGGGGGGASTGPSAAEQKAMAEGKAKTAKENAATQGIIDALLKALGGYDSGRNTQIQNAAKSLEAVLKGVQANYLNAVGDYQATGLANEQDEASKSAANVTNRARERTSLLEQAASQGAGETDQLRAQLQAFQNFDNNSMEINRSFYDTARSLNSQIAGANTQAEASRRSAWQQNQEAVGQAWSDYWKNYGDTWTNIQRTIAGNTNVDTDYSEGFNANTGGQDAATEASKFAGKAYEAENKDEKWFKNFLGRTEERKSETTSANRAASATIKAPKAAEGATLRGKW